MIEKTKVGGSSVSESESEVFCSNLSFGLHAVAQPLTIVRASLFKSYTDRMSRDELQELAGTMSLEVERICALFSCLQQLVHIESIKPSLSAMPILPLLVCAADGVDLLYKDSGMLLSLVLPESCESVLVDRQRTIEALSSVLLVAHTLSRAKDTVELIASSSSSSTTTIRVTVQNVNSRVNALHAQASLSLALAGANIRSQGAILSWSLQPFRVEMELQRTRSQSHEAM